MLEEIAMLKTVGQHRNVIALLGCITLQKPYRVVLELALGGELLAYLRALRQPYSEMQMNKANQTINPRSSFPRTSNFIDIRRSRYVDIYIYLFIYLIPAY